MKYRKRGTGKTIIQCKTCNKDFVAKKCYLPRTKFCSRRCYNDWQRGRELSDEHKRKISEAQKRIGNKPPSPLGRKLSIEARKRMSERQKGVGKGRKASKKTRMRMSKSMPKGSKHHNWKGGVVSENRKVRVGTDFRLWREAVFTRDNWTCQRYGIRSGIKLHPHHIKNFSDFPELRFAIDNGITLSEKAHMEFHNKYGRKNNTKEQLEEFLNQ